MTDFLALFLPESLVFVFLAWSLLHIFITYLCQLTDWREEVNDSETRKKGIDGEFRKT